MALHEQSVGASDEWYTPKYIFETLGCVFDCDVAHPGNGHAGWVPAMKFINKDSLDQMWDGFIWMNPPFGGRNGLVPWLTKFIKHANGICLVPDRTSAPWWQEWAPYMDVILFVSPKIKFIDRSGVPGKSPAQGTCLGGIGARAIIALLSAETAGLGVLFQPVRKCDT